MKYLIVITLFFILGCIETKYEHRYYDSEGRLTEVIKASHFKANVNDAKDGLAVSFADGTKLGVDKVTTTADPNSAIAEGQAIGSVLKGVIK